VASEAGKGGAIAGSAWPNGLCQLRPIVSHIPDFLVDRPEPEHIIGCRPQQSGRNSMARAPATSPSHVHPRDSERDLALGIVSPFVVNWGGDQAPALGEGFLEYAGCGNGLRPGVDRFACLLQVFGEIRDQTPISGRRGEAHRLDLYERPELAVWAASMFQVGSKFVSGLRAANSWARKARGRKLAYHPHISRMWGASATMPAGRGKREGGSYEGFHGPGYFEQLY
jgi:hypothetical protein